MIDKQQITQEESNEFHALCNRALEIYNKCSQNESKRKIIVGSDAKGNCLIFLQANIEEIHQIYEYLKTL